MVSNLRRMLMLQQFAMLRMMELQFMAAAILLFDDDLDLIYAYIKSLIQETSEEAALPCSIDSSTGSVGTESERDN